MRIHCLSAAALVAMVFSASVYALELPNPAPYRTSSVEVKKVKPKLIAQNVVSHEGKTITIPVFTAGNKRVTIGYMNNRLYTVKHLCDVNIFVDDKEVSLFKWWGSNKNGFGYPYKNIEGIEPKIDIDPAAGVATVTKAFIDDDGKEQNFVMTMKSIGESKVEVSWNHAQLWHFTRNAEGLDLSWGEQNISISDYLFPEDKTSRNFRVSGLFKYNCADLQNGYCIDFGDEYFGSCALTKSFRGKLKEKYIEGIVRYDTNLKKCVIDLGDCIVQSKKTPPPIGGIDFWKNDRLHIPTPATRNLLPNPSFEQGFRFWHWVGGGAKYMREKHKWEIVPEGLFGKNALAIHSTQYSTPPLESFPMALDAGKSYTLSFYAKCTNGKSAGLSVAIASVARSGKFRGKYGTLFGDGGTPEAQFNVTDEWKRYSRTFTADSAGIRIIMGSYSELLIDGMQLEAGAKMTEFTLPPIEGNFVTANPDNDLVKGEPIGGAFVLQGKKGTTGKMRVAIINAYSEKILERNLNVKIGDEEIAKIDFPIDPKVIGEGIFVVRAAYSCEGKKWIQYYRFSVMEPLNNTHATKTIFGNLHAFDRISRGDDLAKKYRDWGFGSTSWGYHEKDAIRIELEKKYGIKNYIHVLAEKGDRKLGPLIRKITEVTDDMAKEIEELAYNEAKKYDPEQAFSWALYNEEEGSPIVTSGKFDDYFKLQSAAYRGFKRANPNVLVSATHGTSGYGALRGYDAYEGYFKAASEHGLRYDIVGIHPYNAVDGATLGAGDLDVSINMLRDQMKRYGYPESTPIYLSEMFNVPFVNVPEWNAPNWGDIWRNMGTFSYAFGNREFIHAASAARAWLIALKHWPKVEMTNVWMSEPFIDIHLTPFLLCKVSNTMGHLLGDVKFHSESKPSANIRAYVYERKDDKPIAAIWCIDNDVENGLKRGPVVDFKFNGKLKFIDLMGVERNAPKSKNGVMKLRLTPAPLFIIADDADKLSAALKAITSDDVSSTLAISVEPELNGKLYAKLRNKTDVPKEGTITIDGRAQPYKLGPLESKQCAVDSRKDNLPSTLYRVNPKLEVKPSGGDKFIRNWKMDYVFIPRVNEPIDWNAIKPIKMTNRHQAKGALPAGDHEAVWKAAWDKSGLSVRVEVEDSDFVNTDSEWEKPGSEKALWNHDGALEIYFDCGANGRSSQGKKDYDDDDYRYDFAHKNASGVVWRWKEVNQQYADGVNMPTKEEASKKVKCDFERTEKGYAYTIKFEERYILPITLRKGFKFGFALYLHDIDSDGSRKALTTGMQEGAHCQADPANWPLAILSE